MQRAAMIGWLLSAGEALAHPGHGPGGWLSATLAHGMGAPGYLAMILLPAVAIAAWLGWRASAARAAARRSAARRR